MKPDPDSTGPARAPASHLFALTLYTLLILVWVVVRLSHAAVGPSQAVVLSGLAIIAGSFLLTWAAEAAERDVPQAFALGILALIIVVPEYAVDMYFAWAASTRPEYLHYPTANMTGANRILIGWGWALIALLYMLRNRKPALELESPRRIELSFLYAATFYSFIIPLKGTLSLADAVVFLLLFVLYARCLARSEHKESELVGPALTLAEMPTRRRRGLVAFFMLLAGAGIFLSAEPFSEGLIAMGAAWHIDPYLLVQWVAPLASEAPELIIATILTLKSKPSAAFGTLISSKVNQWTLLVSMLPVAFNVASVVKGAIPGGRFWTHVLPLDIHQRHEMFLTSAQSLFAAVVLSDFVIAWWEAVLLFGLFTFQMLVPVFYPSPALGEAIRLGCAYAYLALALAFSLTSRSRRRGLADALIQFLACSGVRFRPPRTP